jgi:phosphoribosylanthranilate isomerase
VIAVKICGITTPEDAALAAELGASAIGLVFWPKSPRAVDVARARAIVAALPPSIPAVGVFVNQQAEARRVAEHVGLAAVQFHGDESVESYRDFPIRVIKAVAVAGDRAIEAAHAVPHGADVLLDAHDPVRRGGTGRTIDWSVAAEIARHRTVILSGGLNPENVVEAIAAVRPAAIDVSSGVEATPGRKDPAKLRALFDVLRDSSLPHSSLPHSSLIPFGIRHSTFGIDHDHE